MSIAVEETLVAGLGDGGGNSFSFASWTPGSNELVLVGVGQRDESISISVAGNGLTFVEIANVDNVQGQLGVALFRAMGASPTTGQITVTVTGNTEPVSAVVTRFSGVDTSGTNGSGAIEATATDVGPDPDNDDMLISVTTVTANAWALACGGHRARTFTVPGGQTAISINQMYGTGGSVATCSTWYVTVAIPAATTVGGLADLSFDSDWCIIGVSIKPAAAAAGNPWYAYAQQ